MEISYVKDFLSACQDAKRITELMPPLPKGMSPRHIYVIDAVFQLSQCQEKVMVSDVSRLLGVTRPSITKVIQDLEKLKALTKIPDQEDKRIVHIALTSLGKEYYDFYVGGRSFCGCKYHLPGAGDHERPGYYRLQGKKKGKRRK